MASRVLFFDVFDVSLSENGTGTGIPHKSTGGENPKDKTSTFKHSSDFECSSGESMGDSNLKLLNSKLIEKIKGLNEQIADLKLNNERLSKPAVGSTVSVIEDNAQSKIDQLLVQVAAYEDENKKLRENVQHIQNYSDSIVKDSQNEINQLKQSLNELQNINSSLQNSNDEISKENSRLQGKNVALTKEVIDVRDELTKENSRLQGKNAALTKELMDTKEEYVKVKTAAQDKNAALVKELAGNTDELSRENSILKSKISELKKELAGIKDQLVKDQLVVDNELVAVDESTKPSKSKTKAGKKTKKSKQVKSVFNMDDLDIYDSESNKDAVNISQLTSSSVASSVSLPNKVNDRFIANSVGTPSVIDDMEQKLSEIQRDDQLSWSGCMKNLSIYPSSPYHRNNVSIKKDLSEEVDSRKLESTRIAPETVSNETQPHLIVLLRNGEKSNNLRVIDANGVTIGRESDCDIRIKLPSVSRQHAKLIINNKGLVVLQNFSKTNPTLLNDVAIDSAVLKNGDIICIANRYFRFQGNESIQGTGSSRNDHIKFSGSQLHKPVPAGTINALSLYNKLVSKTDKKNIYSETESSIIRKISRFS